MSAGANRQRWKLVFGGIGLCFLLAAVFTFGSLEVPFEPKNWRDVLTLYAVSSFITAALLVFGLILTRTLFRLWAESRREQLGARFKTKMLVGAMAISLLPVLFMFFVSYALLNRTLLRWFPRPLEIASEQTQVLLNDLGKGQIPRLQSFARQAGANLTGPGDEYLIGGVQAGADGVWILDKDGGVLRGGVACDAQEGRSAAHPCIRPEVSVKLLRTLPSGIEVWQSGGTTYFASRVARTDSTQAAGWILAGLRTNPNFLARFTQIQEQTDEYYAQKQNLRALKRQMLLILVLFTVLVLFAVSWVALFLAKQVTIPIQALAEGTREVSSGNFEYQVPEQAQDELGVLVRSFNAMTLQLRDSRAQIDEFTRNLQHAVQELERRRQLMETILESIPTAVLSLDSGGAILRRNSAVHRMFPAASAGASSLDQLLGSDSARVVQHLLRRALRMGVITREMETVVSGRVLHLALTVSALGPRRANGGFVLVLDDLTELLRAQKAAAWQEVAQRIAHEIKNPLTPIQLSAQRLSRFLEQRTEASESDVAAGELGELKHLVAECSRLIEREVSTMAALVSEFSQFVRFPAAKLGPTDANAATREAIDVFADRLEGITVKMQLDPGLPAVRGDHGLLRSVLVNLIDNAAEALEGSGLREIVVTTRSPADSDLVEIAVSDTGHGISPQDKDKLFLPHFSTKERGTGLGLAIVARIVAEHGGSVHVEDNFPVGSRFVVELPAAEQPASVNSAGTGSASA